MTMVAEPASVAPGGTVTLKINTTDAEGRGVAGQQLNMIASAGTLGAIQDMGGGQYQTTLSVPVGLAGEVKLSAGAPDGSVAAFASVPISGASGWGTIPERMRPGGSGWRSASWAWADSAHSPSIRGWARLRP